MNCRPDKALKFIRCNVEKYLISEGFDPNELEDHYSTSWTYGRDRVQRVNVRAEVSLEGRVSIKLANILTEAIAKHCGDDCYFDVVIPGVLCCVVE